MKGIGREAIIVIAALVIALVILLLALAFSGQAEVAMKGTALEGYLSSCCNSYRLGGWCEEDDAKFPPCTVPKEFAKDGYMDIRELLKEAGHTAYVHEDGSVDLKKECKCP